MVLQHAHSLFRMPQTKLEGTRIVAIAGALALNIAILMLLLIPMSRPMLAPVDDSRGDLIWVLPEKKILPPPIMDPPEKATVKPQERTPRPSPPQSAPITPTETPTFETGTLPVEPVVTLPTNMSTSSASIPTTPTGPIAGVELRYQNAPAPRYPIEELRNGVQGTVMLQVLVDLDGKPLSVDIYKSSGNRALDEAARRQVLKRWTFQPAMKDGQVVQAFGIVPIEFKM